MFTVVRTITTPTRLQTRRFTSSVRRTDIAKLTLVGRLGKEPVVKTNVNQKEYVVYTVATANPPGPPNEDGRRREPTTSWHSIISFNPGPNNYLKSLQKGSLVYVEANYELREADPMAELDSPSSRRQIFLRHENIRLLARPPSPKEEE